eukprot:Gb_17116 [translate_table: standard]
MQRNWSINESDWAGIVVCSWAPVVAPSFMAKRSYATDQLLKKIAQCYACRYSTTYMLFVKCPPSPKSTFLEGRIVEEVQVLVLSHSLLEIDEERMRSSQSRTMQVRLGPPRRRPAKNPGKLPYRSLARVPYRTSITSAWLFRSEFPERSVVPIGERFLRCIRCSKSLGLQAQFSPRSQNKSGAARIGSRRDFREMFSFPPDLARVNPFVFHMCACCTAHSSQESSVDGKPDYSINKERCLADVLPFPNVERGRIELSALPLRVPALLNGRAEIIEQCQQRGGGGRYYGRTTIQKLLDGPTGDLFFSGLSFQPVAPPDPEPSPRNITSPRACYLNTSMAAWMTTIRCSMVSGDLSLFAALSPIAKYRPISEFLSPPRNPGFAPILTTSMGVQGRPRISDWEPATPTREPKRDARITTCLHRRLRGEEAQPKGQAWAGKGGNPSLTHPGPRGVLAQPGYAEVPCPLSPHWSQRVTTSYNKYQGICGCHMGLGICGDGLSIPNGWFLGLCRYSFEVPHPIISSEVRSPSTVTADAILIKPVRIKANLFMIPAGTEDQEKKESITSYILGARSVPNEQVRIAPTEIDGIGPKEATQVRYRLGISDNIKVNESTKYQIDQIEQIIGQDHVVHWELKRGKRADIERSIPIPRYRGIRHQDGSPLRGQRTHTNARTCRKFGRVPINQRSKKEE